jgi:hypothetical protein
MWIQSSTAVRMKSGLASPAIGARLKNGLNGYAKEGIEVMIEWR